MRSVLEDKICCNSMGFTMICYMIYLYSIFLPMFHDFPMSLHLLFIKKKSDKSEKAILREKDSSRKRRGPLAGVSFVPSRKKPVR